MIAATLFGAICGLGAALCVRAAASRPAELGRALARLDRQSTVVSPGHGSGWTGASGQIREAIAGRLGRRVERDLVVLDRSAHAHATEKLTCAVGFALTAIGTWAAMRWAGAALAPGLASAAVAGCAAAGYTLPDIVAHRTAERRRDTLRHALSSYLDLVNVLLAGGAGVETALVAAADAGGGWAFTQIRHALVWSRSTRRSPWDCFADLGRRMAVDELVEVAASLQLAGEHGARIRMSLTAKAAALRAHQSARIEAAANAATERMGLPTVLMFVSFMVLLGYPALRQIVGEM